MKFSFGSRKKKSLDRATGAHAAPTENKAGVYVHPADFSSTSPKAAQSSDQAYAASVPARDHQNVRMKAQPQSASQDHVPQKNQRPLSHDIAALLIRVAAMASIFLIIFSFIFDVFRAQDNDMAPSIQEGDMVVAYRLDKRYSSQDVVAFSYEGEHATGRVVAIAGDTVDIDKDGLLVNGAHQYEPRITQKTQPVKDGVTFPIKVPEGQVFVLCDAREGSTDSRVLGTLTVSETEGKVIAIFRRRNI